MTLRTGQGPAGHAPGVDRVAVDREPARQEPLLLLRAEQRVSQQVDVFRDPQDLSSGGNRSQQCGQVTWDRSFVRASVAAEVWPSVLCVLAIAVTAIHQRASSDFALPTSIILVGAGQAVAPSTLATRSTQPTIPMTIRKNKRLLIWW